jgi:hypothetical protein
MVSSLCLRKFNSYRYITVRVIGPREQALVLLQWFGACCVPLLFVTKWTLGSVWPWPTVEEAWMLAGTAVGLCTLN